MTESKKEHGRRWAAVLLLSGAAALLLPGCGESEEGEDADSEDAGAEGDTDAASEPGDMASDRTDPPGEEAGDPGAEPAGPWVRILLPEEETSVANPVTFEFETGGGVQTVWFECDGWPLQDAPIPADQRTHTYRFTGVNVERLVVLIGQDAGGLEIARDEVNFTPTQEGCSIPDQPGFNHYTVAAINDTARFPRDGTYPYCWSYYGDTCGGTWGQIYDGYYAAQLLFPGGADCFCSGHTLEIFLRAYQLWQTESGAGSNVPFTVDGRTLAPGDVDIGDFYQRWQGFGITSVSSSADAFEYAGIGQNIYEEDWDQVLPGDYVNLSRTTGTGHAVIFAGWIEEGGEKTGLRYYGCNGSGDSCPDPADPDNTTDSSGPSFNTEYFDAYGGTVMPEYLFIGRVFMPTL